MNKTRKKLVGGLGLALVAGMTFVAAQMPSPGASAVDGTTSVTDTITVRVVDPVADVQFTQPAENLATYNPNQTISFAYSKADKVVLKMSYAANGSDTVRTVTYAEYAVDYDSGEFSLDVNLDENYLGTWGYGKFVWTLEGYDYNGVKTNEDEVEINYQPILATFDVLSNGSVDVDLQFDGRVVEKNNVSVYRSDAEGTTGALVNGGSKDLGNATFAYNVSEKLFTELGWYKIVVTSYVDGEAVYSTYYLYHLTELPDTGAPNTGGLFQNLNISREDYLVTGLIVFFVFAVVAFGVVARGRHSKKTSSSSRRR